MSMTMTARPRSRSPNPGSPTTPTLAKKRKRASGRESGGGESSRAGAGGESTSPVLARSLGAGAGPGREGWSYELDIIQNPLRARACGFGNKPNGELVDPSLVDTSMMVLMVDLWSADGKQERNVVRHPTGGNFTFPKASTPWGQGSGSQPGGPAESPGLSSGTGASLALSSRSSGSWQHNPHALGEHTASPWTTSPQPISYFPPTIYTSPPQSSSWDSLQPPRPSYQRVHSFSSHQPEYDQPPSPPRPSTAPTSHPHYPPISPPSTASSVSHRPSSGYALPSLASISEDPSAAPRLTLPALQAQQQARPTSSSSSLWNRPRTSHSTDLSTAPTDFSMGRPMSSSSMSYATPTEYGGKDRPQSSWSDARPGSSGWASVHRLSAGSSSDDYTLSPRSMHYHRLSLSDGVAGFPPPPVFHQPLPPSVIPPLHSGSYPPIPGQEMYRPTSSGVGSAGESGVWDAERPRFVPSPAQTSANTHFSHVLVGKLSATCHRLQDEHGRPGLFFFATDMGVRTEGRFKLRMRVMDLGVFSRPGLVSGDSAPILAQTWSTPVDVFSAKRFPGVIPTTPLTRVFAAQGVKLAVRENHKKKRGGKKRGDDEDDDDDEDEDDDD
ncbi:hypothetical protein IAT38_000831 [Cryptococcus sp. DSM 104549]